MILRLCFIVLLVMLAWLVLPPVSFVLASEYQEKSLQLEELDSCIENPLPRTMQQTRALPQPDDCSLQFYFQNQEVYGLYLPDLRTLPPGDLKIVVLPDGSHELRLSNTIWNSGLGRLELQSVNDSGRRTSSVEQVVYNGDEIQYKHPVGEFIWHPAHDHFHFEEFSIYELWTLSPTGKLDRLISTSGKLSYCVIDTGIVNREVEGFSPYKRYGGCGQELQGLSIGWGDTYESHLDGQSIPVPENLNGTYALKSTVNPFSLLLESDYGNNAYTIYLDITGKVIRQIDIQEYFERLCQDAEKFPPAGLVCGY